jgi:amino acid transporter
MHGTAGRAGLAVMARERSPLHGLARRSVPFSGVLGQSVSGAAPAAVMATGPLLVMSSAGQAAAWCYLVATVVAGLAAYCINQFTRRLASTGGLYTFTARGLGPGAGFASGVGLLAGYAFIGLSAQVGLVMCARATLDRAGLQVPGGRWTTLVAVTAVGTGAALLALTGIRISAWLALVLEACSIAGMVTVLIGALATHGTLLTDLAGSLLAAAGLAGADPAAGALSAPPVGLPGPTALFAGVLLALAGFVGFESAAGLGAEARRPLRSVPRAVTATALGAGLLYTLAALSAVLGVQGGASAQSTGSLPGWIHVALDVGISSSFLACVTASTNAFARVLFSMAREGVAPRQLGRAGRRRAPHLAVLALVPLSVALSAVPLLAGLPPGRLFAGLLTLGTCGILVAYTLTAMATPAFLHRIGELTWQPVAASLVVISVCGPATAAGLRSALTSDVPGLPQVTGLVVAAGLAWFTVVRLIRPLQLRRIGVYDEATRSDLRHHRQAAVLLAAAIDRVPVAARAGADHD